MGNYSVVRTFRVFRALRTVTVLPSLRLMVNALLRAIRGLSDVLLLITSTIILFSIVALQLLQGRKGERLSMEKKRRDLSPPLTFVISLNQAPCAKSA